MPCQACVPILFLTTCGSGLLHCCRLLLNGVITIPSGCVFRTVWHSPV